MKLNVRHHSVFSNILLCRGFQNCYRRATAFVAAAVLLLTFFFIQPVSLQVARADTGTAILLNAIGTAYTQNFDSLVSSGTGTLAANTPVGWGFVESGGTNPNTSYTADNGSSSGGDTFSFGSTGNSERAFGQLNTTNAPSQTIGAKFTNNTGSVLTSLDIAYTGEQWRSGDTGNAADILDFEYSTDAMTTSLTTGAWTAVNQLDFTSLQTTLNAAPLNGNAVANRAARSHSITGLSIANGATFWIRWTSPNISGTDDSLAIDDFSLTPQAATPADNPPAVSATVPADNAVNVAENSNISITFNEPVSASANSFQIICAASGAHLFALSGGATVYTLDPTTDFAQNEVCTVTVFASLITDQDGTPHNMAQDYVFDFTTFFPTSTNPSGVGAANPSSLSAGNPTLLTVTVTPGTNPTSTGITVTADLTSINGSAAQQFFDDGTNGDQTGGDNVFSYQYTLPNNVSSGTKTVPVTISDSQPRTGTASISLTVTAPLGGQPLPFSQNWSNTNLITVNNDWSAVPGIVGYLGSDPSTTQPGANPQNILADLSNTPVWVVANQTDPLAETAQSGGVAEFELANPTIAIKGSGTADAAHIVINLDTTNQSNITVSYNLRDLDASSNNAVQPVALQYRIGNTGNFTNVPAAFVADASIADEATLVTPVAVLLPAAVNNQPLVQLRIITANALGADEWIGIDDILIAPNGTLPITATGAASPNQVNPGNQTLLTVTVNPGSNPTSTNISVIGDLTPIGGSATQQFFDDGTNGDAMAGDNIFSFAATIPANAPGGGRSLLISIADGQNRTAATTISLTIIGSQDLTEHLALGNPSNAMTDVNQPFNYLLSKPQYALSYHRDRAIPNWASWHLDSTWIGGARRQDDFRPDSTLPAGWYQVTDDDYSGSGFDRGHHVPSGDRTRTIPDNSATFLMTNMMPQAGGNNQGPWNNLEIYSRTLAGQGNELYIVAGGIGTGGIVSGTNVVNTIAGGKVTVPSQTWKVILVMPVGDNDASRVNANTRTIAVIMPNNENIRQHAWQQYIVSVDQVEALTGYNFFSEVPVSIQNQIEAKIDGTNCTFSINPTSANAPSSGNNGSVGVTAGQSCGWTATSSDAWITITGGATGSGNATVNYTVAANTGAARTGTLTIGGQTFTINQAAPPRSISGTITYGTDQSKFVPGAMVNASGTSDASARTSLSGFYSLEGLIDGGNYAVTPTKNGDINGINAFDATLVLRCIAAGNSCALTSDQQFAADTDGDNDLSAFDATMILRFVAAGGQNANTGQVGNWKFDPISVPHPALSGNISGENYTGFLIGDIDGDWKPPSSLP